MSRRRSVKQDSLELLLDTICNTFGGVLFIAIMVVMLLQQTGQGPDPATAPPPTPEELEARSHELAVLSADVLRQQQIRASQATLVESLVPDTVRELIERRKNLLAEQAQLQASVDAQQAANAVLAARVTRTQSEIDQLQSELRQARQREIEARTQLASEQQGRVKSTRLPLQRAANDKREVGFILRYGRLYLWHDYDLTMRRTGLNLRDFVVVENAGDHLVTRPKPTAGIPLNDTPQCQAAIDKILRRFNHRRDAIAAIVRPDSYAAFRYFRDRASTLGFEYRLMPVGPDSPIADRGGTGGRVQ